MSVSSINYLTKGDILTSILSRGRMSGTPLQFKRPLPWHRRRDMPFC